MKKNTGTGKGGVVNVEESDNKLGESTPKPSKTFLVRFGLLSVGIDDTRESFRLGLVKAPNLLAAYERAWKAHCPEAFEAEDDGEWTDHNDHRAYQLSANHCDVDANCIFWLDEITEVPAADVPVLIKYLSGPEILRGFVNAERAKLQLRDV